MDEILSECFRNCTECGQHLGEDEKLLGVCYGCWFEWADTWEALQQSFEDVRAGRLHDHKDVKKELLG